MWCVVVKPWVLVQPVLADDIAEDIADGIAERDDDSAAG